MGREPTRVSGERRSQPGKNVIAIRVLKTKPDGGFLSKPEDLHLSLGDQSIIPLAGEWKAKISVDARPPQPLPIAYENWPVMPTVLYEGMLAPSLRSRSPAPSGIRENRTHRAAINTEKFFPL